MEKQEDEVSRITNIIFKLRDDIRKEVRRLPFLQRYILKPFPLKTIYEIDLHTTKEIIKKKYEFLSELCDTFSDKLDVVRACRIVKKEVPALEEVL